MHFSMKTTKERNCRTSFYFRVRFAFEFDLGDGVRERRFVELLRCCSSRWLRWILCTALEIKVLQRNLRFAVTFGFCQARAPCVSARTLFRFASSSNICRASRSNSSSLALFFFASLSSSLDIWKNQIRGKGTLVSAGIYLQIQKRRTNNNE